MSRLADLLTQIHDTANEIGYLARYKEMPDPSALYVEPHAGNAARNVGPSINLGCHGHGSLVFYQWGGGGRVDLTDLLADARKHLEAHHG